MKYWIIGINCFLAIALNAQEYKRNNNWVLGLGPLVKLSFNNGVVISSLPVFAGTSSHNSCISDTNGIFQFYSTGYGIGAKDGSLMSDGYPLNCPGGDKMCLHYGGGSLYPQNDIIIPKSGKQYYVFATGMHDTNWTKWKSGLGFNGWDYLNYSVVDMDSNNGMGKVLLKNQVILDSQSYDNPAMSAVRHANGKDWWLVHEDYRKHGFQIFRVTPDSIIGPTYQYVPVGKRGNFWAQQTSLIFSPDGTKMASTMYSDMIDSSIFPPVWEYNRVDVFDFDANTGILNYRQHYKVLDTIINGQVDEKRGICFSPDNKFLYLSCFLSMHQIDLSDTIIRSAIKVKDLDTTWQAFPSYNTMALGPDCKIYIGNFGGTRKYMSTIDNPNVKGLGCNFHANAVYQPYTNIMSPPNMPFYGINHPCEPLGVEEIVKREDEIIVYPNPNHGSITIEGINSKEQKNEVFIYNMVGQVVYSSPHASGGGMLSIDISNLVNGIYLLKVGNFTKKIVKE